MAVRNLSFEAANEVRFFPFDDSAALQDDAGQRPPLQILADVRLLVPEPAGKYVYLGSLAVTPRLVTAVFMASLELDEPGIPIAAISQSLPLNRHYPYAVSAQLDGTGGWAAFGDLTDLLYRGQFELPLQSLISPLAARNYRVPPIQFVRSEGGLPLYGLVRLRSGNDVEIVKECRVVPNFTVGSYHESYCTDADAGVRSRDVIVFRLKNKTEGENRNVFQVYSGPCAKRPANRTCDDPQPVEFLGATGPDCEGNINVVLLGCLDMVAVQETVTFDDDNQPVYNDITSGVLLSCGLALDDACTNDSQMPDADGRLPSEYEGLFESITSINDGAIPPPDEEDSLSFSFSFDAYEASLSFADSISEDFSESSEWVVRFGLFEQQDYPFPLFYAGAFSRNVVTYEPAELPNGFYRRAQSRLQINSGPAGALHNASVVANYQSGSYYVAELDWDSHYRGTKLFRIAKFSGSLWHNLLSIPAPWLQLGHQYELSLEIVPQPNHTDAWLTARVQGVTVPSVDYTIGPVSVEDYGESPGLFGLGTNRSPAYFLNFEIQSL